MHNKLLRIATTKMTTTIAGGLVAACGLMWSGGALAAMGNLGSSYGVLPYDVATTQALSLTSSRISSLYYNPASLVRDPSSSITLSMLLAENVLGITPQGGPRPANRVGGSTILGTPAKQLVLGLKTDLSAITNSNIPMYFGFMVGVEKFGREMLAFNSATSIKGQYLQQGQRPLI